MLIFERLFLPQKWWLVATFSETNTVSSKKYVVKKGMKNSKSFKNFEFIWLHYYAFGLH